MGGRSAATTQTPEPPAAPDWGWHVTRSIPRPSRRRAATVALCAAALAIAGAQIAFAAPAPPTVAIADGGDGYVTAAEQTTLTLTGTYDTTATPAITSVIARIVNSATCENAAPQTTTTLTVPVNGDGTWSAGPYDVSAFTEGAQLCARARTIDATAAQSELGTSAISILDRVAPAAGTATLDDADGFINAAEAAAGVDAGWTDPGAAATAAAWFADGDGNVPAGCSLGTVAVAGSGQLTPACAAALPDGSVVLNVRWTDAAGNTSPVATDTSLKDTVAPATGTVEMIDPNEDGYVNIEEATTACCVPANWANADTSASSVSLWFLDSADVLHTPQCGTWVTVTTGAGAVNGPCATTMAQGEFAFVGQWRDAAGNLSDEARATLVLDTVAPTVTIAAPTGASVAPTFQVAGTTEASAPLVFLVDGLPVGTDTSAADGTFARTFSLPDGPHVITIRVTDAASNVTNHDVSLTVDSLIPLIATPGAGSLQDGVVTVSGTGRPNTKIEIFEGATLVGQAQTTATGAWTTDVGFASGAHEIRARGIGLGGSPVSAFTPSRAFSVDAGRPTVTITTPNMTPFVGEAIVIDGTATDGSKVARIRLEYVDAIRGAKLADRNATCTNCGTPSATWTDSVELPPGLIAVTATAYDEAGNRSGTVTIRILNVNA